MKTIITLLLTSLIITRLSAQKEDRNWIIGHDYNISDPQNGRIQIDFNQSPPSIDYLVSNVNMNMYICNASISDTTGNLLFYSNGCDIANENGNILFGGNDINPGLYQTALCDDVGLGYYAGYPSMAILPLPENDSLYYLFHLSVKYFPPPIDNGYIDRLLYSVIKVKNSKKVVAAKNLPVMEDSLALGEMNAVKHANGKDWWIILPRRNSNQFYTFLFTKDGIRDTIIQTIGPKPLPINEGYGQTAFSPLGDKMFRYFPFQPVGQYLFDRQTGKFTAYDTIHVEYGNEIAFDGGCGVSPNGRYLYITAATKTYQFDLLASDISATQTTVATWDGFKDPVAILFWHCQLGPDCKIYVVGGGDTKYYHIIHNPDEPGMACNFEQRGMVFPEPSGASIPYFPNYRLGPIDNPGSPCSETVSVSSPIAGPVEGFRVYPNPASEYVELEYRFVSEKPGRQLLLFDVYGKEVSSTVIPDAVGRKTLRVGDLPSGIYHYFVSGASVAGNVIVAQKP